MTDEITPKTLAAGLRALRQQGLPHLRRVLSQTPGLERRLEQLLQAAEELCMDAVVLELGSGGQCTVNGKPIPHRGKGVTLAWLLLAGMQTRQPALRPEWIFTGKCSSASALQALKRAADDVERISTPLASVIRAMGVERGLLALKRNPRVHVRCTLSPELAPVFAALAPA